MTSTQNDIFFIQTRLKAIRSECDMIENTLEQIKNRIPDKNLNHLIEIEKAEIAKQVSKLTEDIENDFRLLCKENGIDFDKFLKLLEVNKMLEVNE